MRINRMNESVQLKEKENVKMQKWIIIQKRELKSERE